MSCQNCIHEESIYFWGKNNQGKNIYRCKESGYKFLNCNYGPDHNCRYFYSYSDYKRDKAKEEEQKFNDLCYAWLFVKAFEDSDEENECKTEENPQVTQQVNDPGFIIAFYCSLGLIFLLILWGCGVPLQALEQELWIAGVGFFALLFFGVLCNKIGNVIQKRNQKKAERLSRRR